MRCLHVRRLVVFVVNSGGVVAGGRRRAAPACENYGRSMACETQRCGRRRRRNLKRQLASMYARISHIFGYRCSGMSARPRRRGRGRARPRGMAVLLVEQAGRCRHGRYVCMPCPSRRAACGGGMVGVRDARAIAGAAHLFSIAAPALTS